MSESYDTSKRREVSAAPLRSCQCRLCLALDAADAFIHDHGAPPAAAARHLARVAPGLLHVRAFLLALRARETR